MILSVVGKLIVIHGWQKTCPFGNPLCLHFLLQTGTYFFMIDVADKGLEIYPA